MMSDLIHIEMTLDEARETDRIIKRHINTTRYLLLDMRDRKGWKALGYESFGDYGKKSLGYEKAYLTQLADAGEISIQLGYDSEFAKANPTPPEKQLRPLKAVPEEDRKAIWDEATRKAEAEHAKLTAQRVEEAVMEWKQRSQELSDESNKCRLKIRDLEEQIDLLGSQPTPTHEIIEVIPSDYEAAKENAAKLKEAIKKLREKQDDLVQKQVKAKLKEREKEIDNLNHQVAEAESRLSSLRKHIDSYSSIERMTRLQREQVEKARSVIVELAANMEGFTRIENDKETDRLWFSLSEMFRNGAEAINSFLGVNSLSVNSEC